MTDRPDPLVAAEVDLRGYDYMPLYGDRLFKSETWIAAIPDAKVAALRLWWHAWAHEVPASSLPDNDVLLAEYAGYGLGVKQWKRVRQQALRGFIVCSDGRLYHETMSGWALEAWDKRVKERQRKAAWRAARHAGQDADVPRTETGTERGRPVSVPSEGKRSEAKRSEGKNSDLQNPDITQPSAAPKVKVADLKIASKATTGQDWDDEGYVRATAKTLGVEPRSNEVYLEFKDRVYAAAQARIQESTRQVGLSRKGAP